MSDEVLIRHCAPTLASIKTGSLVSVPFADRDALRQSLCRLNRRLVSKGLRAVPLRYRQGKALIYLYRPEQLKQDLLNRKASDLLRGCGYLPGKPGLCLKYLMQRLKKTEQFPHEIGLFLGYPPEDVEGFIFRRDAAKYSGTWKVYGDVEKAKKTFESYEQCKKCYLDCWKKGLSVEQLTVTA